MTTVALITAGSLGLIYGGVTHAGDARDAAAGPVELSVRDKEVVSLPVWAGVAAIAAGVILLQHANKRRVFRSSTRYAGVCYRTEPRYLLVYKACGGDFKSQETVS